MTTLLSEKSFWLVFWLLLRRVLSIGDFKHIGCFKDKGADRTMPKYLGWYSSSTPLQTIQKCADAIKKKGYIVFGVQHGGECWSSPDAEATYNKHGPATNCADRLGEHYANDVYKIKICRHVFFENHLRAQDKMLSNHSLGQHLVKDDGRCRVQCFLNHECISFNIGPSPTPGMLLCELNNADRYQYPQDYLDKQGGSYRGSKNMCNTNPCLNGATCKIGYGGEGFRCVCPVDFTGEYCKK